jgi:hypothetical protein
VTEVFTYSPDLSEPLDKGRSMIESSNDERLSDQSSVTLESVLLELDVISSEGINAPRYKRRNNCDGCSLNEIVLPLYILYESMLA